MFSCFLSCFGAAVARLDRRICDVGSDGRYDAPRSYPPTRSVERRLTRYVKTKSNQLITQSFLLNEKTLLYGPR